MIVIEGNSVDIESALKDWLITNSEEKVAILSASNTYEFLEIGKTDCFTITNFHSYKKIIKEVKKQMKKILSEYTCVIFYFNISLEQICLFKELEKCIQRNVITLMQNIDRNSVKMYNI